MFGITVVVVYSLIALISSMDVIETAYYGKMICSMRVKEAISIIRPVYGADEFTQNNFSSWENQISDSRKEVIYSMQDKSDESISIAEKLNGKIIINQIKPGYSGKTSNLFHGIEHSKEDIIVMVDSDCYAESQTITKMYRQLNAGYDIVTAVPIHNEAKNLWARLFSMFWNFNQLGLYLNSLIHGNSGNLIGVCIMTRKSVLNELGGISAFKKYIAEDLAMGREASRKGIKIGVGPLVYSPVGKMKFKDLINKLKRAALTTGTLNSVEMFRAILPMSYILGIILILVTKDSGWFVHISLLMALRIGAASLSMYELDKKIRPRVDVILMDVLIVGVYLTTMFDRSVKWGNISYKVDKSGKIIKSKVI